MSLRDLLRYAAGALVGHRLRSLLSLLGMCIGVAAVILLTALGEGARRYVSNQFAGLGTNIVIVIPGRTETTGMIPGHVGVPNDLTLDDYQAIARSSRRLNRSAPVVLATGTVSHAERRRQVAIVGSTTELASIRQLTMSRGQFLPEVDLHRGAPIAVLGAKVATELFPGESPLGKTIRVDGWRMRVVGVLSGRGVQMGMDLDELVVVPVATAMRLFNRNSLFRILLEARSHQELDAVCGDVVTLIIERHDEEDITCITQDSVIDTLSSILATLTLVLAAIASISLGVAGVGIMNVMLVSVSERTEEIGLLKSVGVANRQIVVLFVAEAGLLSAAGGIAGLAIGWLAVRLLVGLYPDLPASPPVWATLAAISLPLVVGMLFGVLPARRASRLDPVEALARR